MSWYLRRRYDVQNALQNGSFRYGVLVASSWAMDAPAAATYSTILGRDRSDPEHA